MKKTTKIATSAALLGTLSAVAYYGVCKKAFEQVFKGKSTHGGFNDPFMSDDLEPSVMWFNESNVYDTWVYSDDNLKLHGVKVVNHPESNLWIILSHGYGSSYRELLDQAMHFDLNGYNVLLISHRTFGFSEGKYITMGYKESDDILVWVNSLIEENADYKIVLYGVSMGASSIMLALGKGVPMQVVAAIEDCGYTDLKSILNHMVKKYYKVPLAPIEVLLNQMMKKKLGFVIKDVNCLEALKDNDVPTLFIHGEDDDTVPFEMVFDNYYANHGVKELYTVSGSQHASARFNEEYYNRIFRFIQRFI